MGSNEKLGNRLPWRREMKKALFSTVMVVALFFLAFLVSDQAAAVGLFSLEHVKGTYSFTMEPVKSFAADSYNGASEDPAGLSSAPRQDIMRVGVFTADGAGHITNGHTIATTDTNDGVTKVIDFIWTGTYTVNADGTGTLTIKDPGVADEGAETYAFVINWKGENKTLDLIQTDNVGGGAKIFMKGQARKQK